MPQRVGTDAADDLAQVVAGDGKSFRPKSVVLFDRQAIPEQLGKRGQRMLPPPPAKPVQLADVVHFAATKELFAKYFSIYSNTTRTGNPIRRFILTKSIRFSL